MLWQPGGTIYPARVDLHDLVTTCSPEQGPGPDLSFFEEYVNFLQGLIDLFFSHFFTYWSDDSRRPGGEGSLSVSNFLFCKVPGNQRVDFWFRPFDSFLVYSVLPFFPFFPFVAGSFATGCYRVFPSLFLLPFCPSALLPFCPSADCPGRRGKTLETVRETAAFLPVCLFVHRNRTFSSNTT